MTTDDNNHHSVTHKFLPEDKRQCNPSENTSSGSSETAADENGRDLWAKKAEYILAAVGYCVGLGNIWRFPYVCMRNGGGAFLIPFILSLFVCALPVYFLETALGQFHGKSALHVWNICPLFKGIGISMNIMTFYVSWYYSMILGWCLIYLYHSFSAPLPWAQCDQWWNTADCIVGIQTTSNTTNWNNSSSSSSFISALNSTGVLMNDTSNIYDFLDVNDVMNVTAFQISSNQSLDGWNATEIENVTVTRVPSAEEFWVYNVLERSSGLEDLGGLPWHTAVSVVVANVVVLIGIIKGIRSTGKVVYITATLPYLLLTVMLILGLTLPGAGDGIIFYIKPDFSKLLESQTWVEAFLQVFYSLGPGWGGLITMGSYNKFKNNCMKDSILLTICCEGTSVYGGFAIFAILGHMAHISGVPISAFAKSGAGLAFIVYPTAISYLPLPQLWSVLFFLMLFTVGLDSQFTNVETVLTTAADMWIKPFLRWRKSISTVTMVFFTLAGIIFATRGGIYVFTIVDWYIAAFCLLIQSAIECIIIGWIYGADRFCRDIELMIGRQPYAIFVFSWKFIAPAILLVVFGLTLVTFTPPTYGTYQFSTSAQTFGWFIAIFPFFFVIGLAVREVLSHQGTLLQRLQKSCQPSHSWGPTDSQAREKYNNVYDAFPNSQGLLPTDVESHKLSYKPYDVNI